MRALRVLLLVVLILGLGVPARAATTRYAAAAGTTTTGNCTTNASDSSACNVAYAISVMVAGDTLILKDGHYTGANYMIACDGKDGTGANRFYIQAENDGAVWIDGQDARAPVQFGLPDDGTSSGCDNWTLEGVNASDSSTEAVFCICPQSEGVEIKRTVGWDASLSGNSKIYQIWSSPQGSLIEDAVGFGDARKIFEGFQSENYTFRRAWGIWNNSTSNSGPKSTFSLAYDSTGGHCENCIANWNADSDADNPDNDWYGLLTTNQFDRFTEDGIAANHDVNATFYNSLGYVKSTDDVVPSASGSNMLYGLQGGGAADNLHFDNVIIHIDNANVANSTGLINLQNEFGGPAASGHHTLDNATLILTGGNSKILEDDWDTTNIRENTSVATAYTSGNTFYSGTQGGTMCYENVDGSNTTTPLFPWRMAQRALDAGTDAGRTIPDINEDIQDIFGTFPTKCSSSLSFTDDPPASVTSGETFSAEVTISYADGSGINTNASDDVVISLCSGGATLGGTTTVAASSGVAIFNNLNVTALGGASSLELCASVSGVDDATSGSFDVAAVTTYYVDWDSGSDSNDGATCATAWKHAPGDDAASGNVVGTLAPGDTVVFKGGVVYQGSATQNSAVRVVFPVSSGSSGAPITYLSGDLASCGTGRAIIDGGSSSSKKTGIYVWNKSYITIDGLEIRNIGTGVSAAGPAGAAGVEFDQSSSHHGIVRRSLIHDINWGTTDAFDYVIGYGIENNHGSDFLYEYNEIYNAPDKLIETYGGGSSTPGSDDAGDGTIRYNILHDSAVHCVVLTSDNNQVYDNLIWECHNGATADLAPNPGYALKVDQGRDNQIWNNIVYKVSSGFGVLIGTGNVFAHNAVYGVGASTGGPHGGNDEAAIVLYDNDNPSGSWGSGTSLNSNKFYNNVFYYIPNADAADKPKFVYISDHDVPADNEIKNNVFFALSGDTSSTVNRVRRTTSGSTTNTETLAGLATNINTWTGGSGNVVSGNVLVDPVYNGGSLGSFTNFPTEFLGDYSDVDTDAFEFDPATTADITGITVSSPMDVDLRGATRTAFWPGVYDDPQTDPGETPSSDPFYVLGRLLAANMNSTGDQAIPIHCSGKYIVKRVTVLNASVSLDTAAGGVYTATSKGGTALVSSEQTYEALTGSSKFLDLTVSSADALTGSTLYLSLTAAQGSAATASIYVNGVCLK